MKSPVYIYNTLNIKAYKNHLDKNNRGVEIGKRKLIIYRLDLYIFPSTYILPYFSACC